MKLIYWQYFFTPPGGWGNRRSYDFLRYWRAEGHQVWAVAGGTYFPPALVERLRGRRCFRSPEGIAIAFFPAPYHQKQSLAQRVWTLLRFTLWSHRVIIRLQRKGYFLIATVPPPFLAFWAALRKVLCGKPFALELYDAWPQVPEALGVIPPLLRLPIRWLSQLSYRQALLIIALSPGIAQAFPALRTHISYNGTRPELFRRRRCPPFLPFRLIYAGTLGRINHVHFLLHLAEALRGYPAIQLWIVGEGSERPRLEKAQSHLPNLHLFAPVPVENLPYLLSEAHIGLSTVLPLPILATNSANKFYDYLAAGLVVGLNYGGWQAELLEKEGCGFSAASPEAFAEQVLFYYWHRGAWAIAAARARALAERLFDRRKLAQDLLQQLRAALPPDKLPL